MAKKGRVSIFKAQKMMKPTVEELIEELFDGEMKDAMYDLQSFLIRSRMKPQWYATGSFKSTCKGRPVLRLQIGRGDQLKRNYVFMLVYFAGVAETEEFNEYLLHDPEIKEVFFDNIHYCGHCSSCAPGKNIVVLGSQLENVCINFSIRFTNPSKQQCENIKKLIALRKDHIENSVN